MRFIPLPPPAAIGFFAGHGLVPWRIRTVTRSDAASAPRTGITHAGIIRGDGMIEEAREFRGVVCERHVSRCPDLVAIGTIERATEAQLADVVAACERARNEHWGYDYLAILALEPLLAPVSRPLYGLAERRGYGARRASCGDYIVDRFAAAGIQLFEGIAPTWVTPLDLAIASRLDVRPAHRLAYAYPEPALPLLRHA
jgi:hypothetical protein